MRNKVKLYIEGVQADLDNGSFLLLNYTAEDLSNPTIVKNSFSRQITLKGTPRNDEIFGHIYRNDRNTVSGSPYIGPNFDPTRKTSFTIYNESNEILESGYLKLDEVTMNRKGHTYKVTLYGGLGSFLYGLSYKPDGEKMSLADLDFGETLDFTIDKDAVLDAWARIGGDLTKPTKWDILNFAPAYMGLPPAPFDANKCLILPAQMGMTYREDEFETGPHGWTIATLNEKVTGNEAGDYRSYLQKPVIKLSAVINAICNSANNGGYTVNLDANFFDSFNPYWVDAWLTLPLLNDLNIDTTETTTTQTLLALDTQTSIVGGGSGDVGITVQAEPYCLMTGLPNLNYKLWCKNSQGLMMNYLVLEVTLYDSSNNVLGVAKYRIGTDGAELPAHYPQPDFTFDHINGSGVFVDSNGTAVTFPLFAGADGAASFMVHIANEVYWAGGVNPPAGDYSWKMWEVGETAFADHYLCDPTMGSVDVDVTVMSTSTVRTGATITKSALLSGSRTPADYLLSLCKTFGLQLLAHKDSKTIDVIRRDKFYNGGTVDLNGRIDRGRDIVKKPFAFDAKWYLFGNEAKGEYAEYYLSNHGRPFGQYRVNTGYDFDAEQQNMTEEIIFGNFPSLMEASPFYCEVVRNGWDIPSVLLAGGKYALYNGSENKSIELPNFFDSAKTWINASYPMHDDWEKPQFHGPEDAHIDERDTLLLFNTMMDVSSRKLSLTDDTSAMLTLNNNTPCWFPLMCNYDASTHITEMPHFSRYTWSGMTINYQLDWGDPLEIQIPGAGVGVVSNIFDQYWKKYISDRYDADSAVVTAYVDLRGMQVNENLLRQFYAFDGAIWALNRIIDHSLTTFGPTKCEFVKVQDKTNYTSL